MQDGARLLEIGCGWGGLAERAIGRGANVTGLTLSSEQLAFARARLERAGQHLTGVAGSADIRFQDYRDTYGTFDAIASVEMIEAVGEAHWPVYFAKVSECLKPGGVAAIQAITIDERYFAAYRRHTDFIQRYIFPGGMLPTVTRMREEAGRAGLTFETVERFGPSYAIDARGVAGKLPRALAGNQSAWIRRTLSPDVGILSERTAKLALKTAMSMLAFTG